MEEAQVARDRGVRDEAPPDEADLAAEAHREVEHLCMRWMCDEKVVTTTRPVASRKIASSCTPTVRSEPVTPACSTFVESDMRSSTPSAASSAMRPRSGSRPSSGVWSILKSPVWMTVPTGVRTASPTASGIECVMANGSTVKGPTVTGAVP